MEVYALVRIIIIFFSLSGMIVILHLSTTTLIADVDECHFNETCPEHSTCINSIGSFTCACNDGYKRIGNVCIGKPEFMHA